MKRYFFRAFTVFLVFYLTIVAWVFINQKSLMYYPDKNMSDVGEYNIGNTTEIFLTSADGRKIQTWYHEPTKKGMPMVLYLHGNAGNLASRKLKFKELIDMGYGYIAPSWRGFGRSEGSPSKDGLYNDARAAISYLRSKGYKTEDSLIIGESLGSGIAVQMATEHDFKGVFLITPYTSIADRGQEMYWYLPARYLVADNFISIDKIHTIKSPILIVHGDKDFVIPHTHAEKLIEASTDPKKLIIYPGKGHSNLDTRQIFKEMTKFFNVSVFGEMKIAQD